MKSETPSTEITARRIQNGKIGLRCRGDLPSLQRFLEHHNRLRLRLQFGHLTVHKLVNIVLLREEPPTP
jgi:hypothetical protein